MNEEYNNIINDIVWFLEKYENDDIVIESREAKILVNHLNNLQNRIDKAIEFIEMFDIEHLHEICEHNLVDTLEVLLDILKESGE